MVRVWMVLAALPLFECSAQGDDGSDTGATSTTGTEDSADETAAPIVPDDAALCARGAECDLLGASISELVCVESSEMCTFLLTPEELFEWENLLVGCLGLDDCLMFSMCAIALPYCSPDPFWDQTNCEAECDICWIGDPKVEGQCPEEWNGGMDGCDCGCQFVDLDCP